MAIPCKGTVATSASVADVKRDVLPDLFNRPAQIGEYGTGDLNAESLHEYSNLMESGAVSALAKTIGEVVAKLADADPQKVAKTPSWYDRLLGKEVERQVRYQTARKALTELLDDAEGQAQRVRDTLRAIDQMVSGYTHEVARLKVYIQAGREFLDENPTVGQVESGELQFDRPRERFARKLANLATLLSSHEMSITQMRLTRAQAMDMLDRFSETATVLVPVWRQHTLSLITTQNMNPEMVADATRSHRDLMQSLSQTLERIEQ